MCVYLVLSPRPSCLLVAHYIILSLLSALDLCVRYRAALLADYTRDNNVSNYSRSKNELRFIVYDLHTRAPVMPAYPLLWAACRDNDDTRTLP